MGGDIRFLSTFQDITPLVRTQEALLATERRYRPLFQDSPIGLWLEDFSAVEPALMGLRREVGEPLEAFFPAHPERVLELDLDPEVHAIRGDESALAHAFMNLCVNAVDAMPEGGTLTLRGRARVAGPRVVLA